jgi:hypothetical protein
MRSPARSTCTVPEVDLMRATSVAAADAAATENVTSMDAMVRACGMEGPEVQITPKLIRPDRPPLY